MPRDYDNRNRTKSWREIDKMRENKKHGDHRDDKKEQKRMSSAAYQGYKSDLDKIFSGGEVPKYLKDELGEAVVGDPGQLKLIGAITRSVSDDELASAMKAYLAKHDEFPDDLSLLLRVLDYPDEAVQLTVVRALDRISQVQPLEHKQQFILKLDSMAMLADDDDLRGLSEELVARLR